MTSHRAIIDRLTADTAELVFSPPVRYVYRPLVYAREGYDRYTAAFGSAPKEVLFLGMNPGPWGMAQTGVPFGDVGAVRDWMGIRWSVPSPRGTHPKRPVLGFSCTRSEVSGKRLWGWAARRFPAPEAFFRHFFVANYCPLLFVEASGRNRTPDKIPALQRQPLTAACDRALRQTVSLLKPSIVIGIGRFAAERAAAALTEVPVTIGRITHPSPANPAANKGWEERIESEIEQIGVRLP